MRAENHCRIRQFAALASVAITVLALDGYWLVGEPIRSNNIFFDINKGNLTISHVVLDRFIYLPLVSRNQTRRTDCGT